MADYQLTINPNSVLRVADNTFIPEDPKNNDWIAYQQWLADGGVPNPYVEPPTPKPSPSPEDVVLYDHENRLRAIEGEPPLVLEDFLTKARGK